MAPPSIPEIDRAADAYRDARDERMALTETEVEKQKILMALMKKHDVTHYTYDDYDVDVEMGEKVKVKKKRVPVEANGEAE